jgi:hypothetical protein
LDFGRRESQNIVVPKDSPRRKGEKENNISPSPILGEEEEGEDGEEAVLTSISSILPPEPVGEVFDTFELIAGEEVAQAIAQDAIVEDEFALIEGEGGIEAEGEGEESASLLTVELITNGTEGEAPATFIFEADAIGGTEPYTVIWDFDDDSVEESEEQIILHTYDEAGIYNVTVDIIDSEEQIASDSIEITVEETAAESEGEEGEDGCAGWRRSGN